MSSPIRKRMKRWEIPGGIRFITFSCQGRLPLLGNPSTRDLFVRCMVEGRRRVPVEIFAWVVMPEHVHLLARPNEGKNLGRFLLSVKLAFSQRCLRVMRETMSPMLEEITLPDGAPRIWLPGGGFDRNVRSGDELLREIRYIHLNPVKRGLVQFPEQWAWSSVRWWMGQREGEVACDPPPGDPRSWQTWVGYM